MASAGPEQRLNLITQDREDAHHDFADAVKTSLQRSPKELPFRFFYDEEGSRLFEEICDLPEYYLTRAESEILEAHADEMTSHFAPATSLVELGSGSAVKTRHLIESFVRRQGHLTYIPIDISRSALEESSLQLLEDYASLEIRAVAGEYAQGLDWLAQEGVQPKLILWLGSNIGNFERREVITFLRHVRASMAGGDGLLLGVDLRKDPHALEAAYDDAAGVTARFNLNLLVRINRELGGDFDVRAFRHRAIYDERSGRVEMYLESLVRQTVHIAQLGLSIELGTGELIHTENSNKYSLEEIDEVAGTVELRRAGRWLDSERRFCSSLLMLD